MPGDDIASLTAENARLREEVDRLRAIAYPIEESSPKKPEPPDANECDRTTCYLLASNEVARRVANTCLGIVRRQMSEVDWEVIDRVPDLPEGGFAVTVGDLIAAGFGGGDFPGGNIRWYRRSDNDELEFVPTQKQTDAYTAAGRDVIAGVDDLLELAEDTQPHGYGYLLMIDVALAGLKLAGAEFRAGIDWRESMDKALLGLTERRQDIDAMVAESLAGSHLTSNSR